MQRTKKWKMIRKAEGTSVFATSTIFKRIFSLVSFALYFALILILLFKIGEVPKTIDAARHMVWIAAMVVILWFASRVSNTNLHTSYSTTYTSYAFATIMGFYSIIFVIYSGDYKPTSWMQLLDHYYWLLPIMGANILWRLMFAVVEYKTRPFFAIKKMFNTAAHAIIVSLIVLGVWLAKEFVLYHRKFDLEDSTLLFAISIAAILALVLLVIGIVFIMYFRDGDHSEVEIHKTVKLWGALLRLGPVAIWFIASATGVHFDKKEWIFLGFVVALLVMVFVVFFTKREAGGKSKISTLTTSTAISTMVLGAYLFQVWWKAAPAQNMMILLPAILIIMVLNVIWEPKMPKFYGIAYISLATTLSLFAMLLWAAISIGEAGNTKLPFHIDEIIYIPALISGVALEFIVLGSYYWTITRISKYTLKSIKAKSLEGVKHE